MIKISSDLEALKRLESQFPLLQLMWRCVCPASNTFIGSSG